MRDDLLDAQAAIDWAKAQLQVLKGWIARWVRPNAPYVIIAEEDRGAREDVLKVEIRNPLPRIFNAEAGAIVNSIRSSLDLLANILAERNGQGGKEGVSFPICRSAGQFRLGKHAGRKAIKRLSRTDQAFIENLRPYEGGNDLLFALHHTDIMRKHRRLLDLVATPRNISYWEGAGGLRFVYRRGDQLEHGTILARVPLGTSPNYRVHLRLEITLRNAGVVSGKPVIAALCDFASLAESIVQLFDG